MTNITSEKKIWVLCYSVNVKVRGKYRKKLVHGSLVGTWDDVIEMLEQNIATLEGFDLFDIPESGSDIFCYAIGTDKECPDCINISPYKPCERKRGGYR